MKEDKMKALIMDYLEGNLSPDQIKLVADQIAHNAKWNMEYEQLVKLHKAIDSSFEFQPDPSLRTGFEDMLQAEVARMDDPALSHKIGNVISLNSTKLWFGIAAGLTLLLIGTILGTLLNQDGNADELLGLRAEIEATSKLLLTSLNNESASSRIKAVNYSSQVSSFDSEIIEALEETMNNDKNANVRLAALQALAQFSNEPVVREILIASLSVQDQPVVQIALINLLVRIKESQAIEPLKEIIHDQKIIKTVRDEAQYGLLKLS